MAFFLAGAVGSGLGSVLGTIGDAVKSVARYIWRTLQILIRPEVFTPFIIVLSWSVKQLNEMVKALPTTTKAIVDAFSQYQSNSVEWLRNVLPEWGIDTPWGRLTIGLKWIADVWWWILEGIKWIISNIVIPVYTFWVTTLRNTLVAIHDFICQYIIPIYRFVIAGYMTYYGYRYLPRFIGKYLDKPWKFILALVGTFAGGLLLGEVWVHVMYSFGVCKELAYPIIQETPILKPVTPTLLTLSYTELPSYELLIKYPIKLPPYSYSVSSRYAIGVRTMQVPLSYSFGDMYQMRIYKYLYRYTYSYSSYYFLTVATATPVPIYYRSEVSYKLFVGIGYPVPLSYTSSTGYRFSYSIYTTVPYVQRIPSPEVTATLSTQYVISEAEKVSEGVTVSPLFRYSVGTSYSMSITTT